MTKRKHPDYSRILAKESIQIIRKHELAKMLGVSISTLYRMVKLKQLPPPLRTEKGYIGGWHARTIYEWLEEL